MVRITPPVAGALTLGLRTAPVTIVEFGDYQCARCGEFAFGTQTELIRRYVHAGMVRLAWRDAPRLGVQSFRAAMAARAAAQQDKFWAFHDQLFAGHQHRAPLTDAYLRTLAGQLGLDMPAFDRDYTSPQLAAVVRADEKFGWQLGMPGTPAFLVNARPLEGPPTLARFAAEIAKALEDLAA
jgi:protein-disulfide isomerase